MDVPLHPMHPPDNGTRMVPPSLSHPRRIRAQRLRAHVMMVSHRIRGHAEAQTIVENCGSTLILRCSSSENGGTARFASKLIGGREVTREQLSGPASTMAGFLFGGHVFRYGCVGKIGK